MRRRRSKDLGYLLEIISLPGMVITATLSFYHFVIFWRTEANRLFIYAWLSMTAFQFFAYYHVKGRSRKVLDSEVRDLSNFITRLVILFVVMNSLMIILALWRRNII